MRVLTQTIPPKLAQTIHPAQRQTRPSYRAAVTIVNGLSVTSTFAASSAS